ncbi:short-chain dehydrogenase [Rathayibacter sp. AY1G1]|uniref:SDR family oxidoreductase n=1 Tax=Rathayibacter sp. AY1G1 TaxID=2080564 RepID=UPI000CE7A668|nr:SDR family NAD(P)-dependent oxidoreductase [Rathayibacter sp. AY1G1]PPH12522.1 short-chain dehydrogenase [Rathayibacter sp. AY1G1]
MDAEMRVAWVTGAGSGVGRACATALGERGWTVALSGRRAPELSETAGFVRAAGGTALELPFDVAADDARERVEAIAAATGTDRLDAVILSAGANTPRRAWADQSMAEFASVVQTNLLGVVRSADAALPGLRAASGVIVVVSSIAGWRPSPGAGVAYSAGKTALAPVVRTLNDQEADSGVRATLLCPGDIDSDFLRQRPEVPGAAARSVMLAPADIARSAMFVVDAPRHVRIDELVISPLSQRSA